MLQCLLDRAKAVPEINDIVVATTTLREDDPLADWVTSVARVSCFRGSAEDVLSRYFHAAQGHNADLLVRLTADDPLKDPGIMSAVVNVMRSHPTVDYCSTSLRPTFPEGLDVEAFRPQALERAHLEATKPSEREHVTPYIWKNPHLFTLYSFEQERDLSTWRWTVDKPEDLEFVRAIYHHFPNRPLVSYPEIVQLLESHPEIALINAGTSRGEGYIKSLAAETP